MVTLDIPTHCLTAWPRAVEVRPASVCAVDPCGRPAHPAVQGNRFAGQLAIGYVALLTLGAYAYSGLVAKLGLDPFLALAAGGVVGGIAGVLVGLPALRLRTFYFAMTTLGFATIVTQVALAWTSVTGGGIGVTAPTLPEPFDSTVGFYLFCVIVGVVCTWMTLNLARGRVGRLLIVSRFVSRPGGSRIVRADPASRPGNGGAVGRAIDRQGRGRRLARLCPGARPGRAELPDGHAGPACQVGTCLHVRGPRGVIRGFTGRPKHLADEFDDQAAQPALHRHLVVRSCHSSLYSMGSAWNGSLVVTSEGLAWASTNSSGITVSRSVCSTAYIASW
jgi:hypothetical protein